MSLSPPNGRQGLYGFRNKGEEEADAARRQWLNERCGIKPREAKAQQSRTGPYRRPLKPRPY